MTEFLSVEGGRIAYDVAGSGPLVVLSHGIGDRREVYRFLVPRLAQAVPSQIASPGENRPSTFVKGPPT